MTEHAKMAKEKEKSFTFETQQNGTKKIEEFEESFYWPFIDDFPSLLTQEENKLYQENNLSVMNTIQLRISSMMKQHSHIKNKNSIAEERLKNILSLQTKEIKGKRSNMRILIIIGSSLL